MKHFDKNDNTGTGRPSLPDEEPINIESEEESKGTPSEASQFSLCGESDPTREARMAIPQITKQSVAVQVENLLLRIQVMIKDIQRAKPDIGVIPPIRATLDESGAALLEWIFPDFRIGFNLEENPEDSGWHLISNKALDEMTMSGQLKNLENTIGWLYNIIEKNT